MTDIDSLSKDVLMSYHAGKLQVAVVNCTVRVLERDEAPTH
jgi:hypothetical protein